MPGSLPVVSLYTSGEVTAEFNRLTTPLTLVAVLARELEVEHVNSITRSFRGPSRRCSVGG